MADTIWRVRYIRTFLDILGVGVIYQVSYHSEAKKIRKLLPFLDQLTFSSDKWGNLKTMQYIEKESKRQFVWYNIFWIIFVAHQAYAPYGYKPVDPSVEDYELRVLNKKLTDHFWILGDYMLLAYGVVCLSVSYYISGISQLIFVTFEAIRVSNDYEIIFGDYMYLMILTVPALTYYNYNRQKNSKNFFLYQKKVHAMNFEQREIIKNLPDGAVIHKIETDIHDETVGSKAKISDAGF